MAGKNKKAVTVVGEEVQESKSSIDMRSMIRMLMEEQMRVEGERAEARRVVEAEKEEVAREARRVEEDRKERAARAAADKMFEQQMALLRLQAELGEKAASAHREEQHMNRKRDRAVASIPIYREGEDVEEFLLTAERRLAAGEIPEREWLTTISSKLGGKVGCVWQDLRVLSDDYHEVRNRLLKSYGYTAKLAGDLWFGFNAEQVQGLTADQLYHKGVQLLRRVLSPSKIGPEVEFALLRAWVGFGIPKRARAALDSRAISTAAELIDAIQDFLIIEGDRTEGQAAVFKGQSLVREGSSDRKVPSGNCFTCGRPGHKAADCWQGQGYVGSSESFRSEVNPSSGFEKITCYACGEVGHKSTQCPNKNGSLKTEPSLGRQVKAEPKEVPVKPVRRIKGKRSNETVLRMMVNSQEVSVLLDSGSFVTIVPETMVARAQQTGKTVAVRAFGAKENLFLPMAEVPFEVGSLKWTEPVALAPVVEDDLAQELVYGLDLKSKRGLDLVILANKAEQPMAKLKREERQRSGESTGDLKPVADRPAGGSEPGAEERVSGIVKSGNQGTGDGKPVVTKALLEELEDLMKSLGRKKEELVMISWRMTQCLW